jgi:hypothetical protein
MPGILAYHRTKQEHNPMEIAYRGFQPGSGSTYGNGFYMCRNFKHHIARDAYGEFIIENIVDLTDVVILDKSLCLAVHGKLVSLNVQLRNIGARFIGSRRLRIEKFHRELADIWRGDSGKDTSYVAGNIYHIIKDIAAGMSYTGRTDGPCLVMYRTAQVKPQRWAKIVDTDAADKADYKWKDLEQKEISRILSGYSPFSQRMLIKWSELDTDQCVAKCLSFAKHAPPLQFVWMLRDLQASALSAYRDIKYAIVQHRIQLEIPDETLARQFNKATGDMIAEAITVQPDGTLAANTDYAIDPDDEEAADNNNGPPVIWAIINDEVMILNYRLLRRRLLNIVLTTIHANLQGKIATMQSAWAAIDPSDTDAQHDFIATMVEAWENLTQVMAYLSGVPGLKSNEDDDDEDEGPTNRALSSKLLGAEIKFVSEYLDLMFEPLRRWLLGLLDSKIVLETYALRAAIYRCLSTDLVKGIPHHARHKMRKSSDGRLRRRKVVGVVDLNIDKLITEDFNAKSSDADGDDDDDADDDDGDDAVMTKTVKRAWRRK